MTVKAMVPGTLKLRGKDVPTFTRDIAVADLNFYADNPRIYSVVVVNGQRPTQAEIEERLQAMEHVRELVHDIKLNGGLIDPLIVRDGDMVVLEGNSRLAAYRFLVKEDPIRWAAAACTVLPADIDESLVFALLAQYHVKGKKDWAPYEKAGFIYRRFKGQKIDLSVAAPEMGITRDEARHLIAVYEFMIAKGDQDPARWSYYDEFLRSRKIRKARDDFADFDDFVVKEIQEGKIGKAMDLRDKLPIICSAQPKVLKRYMSGAYTFSEAHEHAVADGGENHALNKIKRFQKWLNEATTEEDITEAPKAIRDAIQYHLGVIEKRSGKIKSILGKRKGDID